MLDFGWTELVVIMALAVLVVGPNEIPGLMRGFGRIMRRISYIKYAFTSQFDEFMRDADLDDIRNSVNFETARRSDEFDEAAEDEDIEVPPIEDYSEDDSDEEPKKDE